VLRRALALITGGFLMGCSRDGLTWSSGGDGSLPGRGAGDFAVDRWTLLSDPHVAADLDRTRGRVNMAQNLRQALDEALDEAASGGGAGPSGLIVNGDCAYRNGQVGDYAAFADLCVRPAAAAGVPVHLLLGNHDHRDRFRNSLTAARDVDGDNSADRGDRAEVEAERCASIVEGRHARWFLLDSLDRTNRVSGTIGDAQLRWLSDSLAALDDRPALVMGHHPVDFGPRPFGLTGGLRDGRRLWEVLRGHRHVKAYFFGHTHRWDVARREGLYLVNLPTTAFVFDPAQPRGWVDARVDSGGAELRLRPVGDTPAVRAESVRLDWA
jgi:3',5'-cyclic AMP phosphodiesterase CpdA